PTPAEPYPRSLHDALPIFPRHAPGPGVVAGPDARCQAKGRVVGLGDQVVFVIERDDAQHGAEDLLLRDVGAVVDAGNDGGQVIGDRKSTRLNSSHVKISYA